VVLGRIRQAIVKKDLFWGAKKICIDEAINARSLCDPLTVFTGCYCISYNYF